MEEAKKEQETVIKKTLEVVDILSGKYQVHWTTINNLPKILSKGAYSTTFAARIKDPEYKPHKIISKFVYVTSKVDEIWDLTGFEMDNVVGIIINVPQKRRISQRISPRQFVGLVLPDQVAPKVWEEYQNFVEMFSDSARAKSYVMRRVEEFKEIFDSDRNVNPLPIYGTSGSLYWPQKMTHDEIVQMLKEKEK